MKDLLLLATTFFLLTVPTQNTAAQSSSSPVEVSITNSGNLMPWEILRDYPYLIDALQYQGLYSAENVDYILKHSQQSQWPSQQWPKDDATLNGYKKYLVAIFQNKWDSVALLWVPKTGNDDFGNAALNIQDLRGLYIIIRKDAVAFDAVAWEVQSLWFNDGLAQVSHPANLQKIFAIKQRSEVPPNLLNNFFPTLYNWMQTAYEGLGTGSLDKGTDGTVRRYFSPYVWKSSVAYLFKHPDSTLQCEVIWLPNATGKTDGAQALFTQFKPLGDDYFYFEDSAKAGFSYQLVHQEANGKFLKFAEMFNYNDSTFLVAQWSAPAWPDGLTKRNIWTLYIQKSEDAYAANDFSKALSWDQKAAALGSSDAMYNIGFAYATGQGITKDETIAKQWLKKAAAEKNKAAIDYLKKKGWTEEKPAIKPAAKKTVTRPASHGKG